MIPQAVLNEWYPVAMIALVGPWPGRQTQLLGSDIAVFLEDGQIVVQGAKGQAWPLPCAMAMSGPAPARMRMICSQCPRPISRGVGWWIAAWCG